MKRIARVIFVILLLVCTCHCTQAGDQVSFPGEPLKEDNARDETAGQTVSTVIGDVVILEKSLYTTI